MSVVRRFLVAPSLVRLIRKERGGSRISEGYFAPQAGRTSFVRIDGQHCHLVLVSSGPDGASAEERTEVPRAHGDALLDVCSGKAIYERTSVSLGAGREALIDRYTTPAGLDLISAFFDEPAAAEAFRPPAWFGKEVSGDEAYERHAVALKGAPPAGETALSNAALDAVLDLIEPRFGFGRPPVSAPLPPPAQNAPPAPVQPAPPAQKPPAQAQPAPAPPAAAPPPAASAPPPVQKPPAPAQPAPPAAPPPAASAPPPVQKPPAPAQPAPPAAAPPPAASAPPPVQKPPAPAQPASAPPAAAPPPVQKAAPAPPPVQAAPPPPVTKPAAPAPVATDTAKASPSEQSDTRIEDVIESLSQALGAAIQKPQSPAREDELAASFERWTVRPRRTQQ